MLLVVLWPLHETTVAAAAVINVVGCKPAITAKSVCSCEGMRRITLPCALLLLFGHPRHRCLHHRRRRRARPHRLLPQQLLPVGALPLYRARQQALEPSDLLAAVLVLVEKLEKCRHNRRML